MNKAFPVPYIDCPDCTKVNNIGHYILSTDFTPVGLKELKLRCTCCHREVDLLEAVNRQTLEARQQSSRFGRQVAKSLIQMKDTLPRDKEAIKDVIKTPNHPFTAALLTGLAILAMELSGFGVFAFATWILAHLILNPVGWVLIPIVAAIAIAYRNSFKRERIDELRKEIGILDQSIAGGTISRGEYEMLRDQLLSRHFSQP